MHTPLLNKLRLPAALGSLSYRDMEALAAEIREVLINTVSQTGGHLASNLGVVELTLAMHRCFDSPKDRFVFDVGHQAYTHKILTGRLKNFGTLRQTDGLSGFCRPDESPHDIFSTGHAGSAVSAAMGLVEADRVQGNAKPYTVVVVGDGALTGGMVYEGLNNNVKGRGRRLIVILNENEMSINQNVGALAKYLAELRAKPTYQRVKQETKETLQKIPLLGEPTAVGISHVKSSIKNWLYRSTWFEDMGFYYIGPIDGHNLPTLVRALGSAKWLSRPVLIHVHTTKGKGYHPAEKDPSGFHGIGRFDLETGEPATSETGFSAAFGQKLCAIAARKSNVCAITAAMSLGTGLTEFAARFPGRFFDVGIAEEHAVTFAGGLAKNGMIPVFAVYSTFLQRCYDQIWHDVALQGQKVIFAVDRAGFVGGDGESHQGIYDVAMLAGIPGLEIWSPSSYTQLSQTLDYAVDEAKSSVCIRYPRACEPPVPAVEADTEHKTFYCIGDADAPVLLVTYGRLVTEARQAVDALDKQGIRVRVLQLNRILPIDPQAVQLASDYARVFFFEEGVRTGGVAERFGAALLEFGYRGRYSIHAVEGGFVPQADAATLLARHGLDAGAMLAQLTMNNGQ
ncbi:MAG: 1-deoxy-D-xylulose-5-phosphate synthase [Oscillospiraceae bacterium]|jgi:1-deoxy-D-xylulose-5-phosphate synthase|nr:1-deoxy-D-xylulose-5-phosphate synthase [Oscillospiraceae bacterium]